MKKTFTVASRFCLCLALAAATAVPAAAQSAAALPADSVMKAKALYADAAYAEALDALGTGDGSEAHQYRALCYLALGRTADAERSLEALVTAAPSYTVSESELPPRLVALFTQTRRRVMPAVARRLFTEARDQFQAKQYEQARAKFEQVLELSRDGLMAGTGEGTDLQVLSASYLDIVKTAMAPPAAAAVVTPAPAAAPARAAIVPAPEPVNAAAPAAALAARPVVVVPAVTVRQDIPPFIAPAGTTVRPAVGSVRVNIGRDGKVTSATMQAPIDARYDARVLAAARDWQYKPATRNGEPIESEKVVSIHVGQK